MEEQPLPEPPAQPANTWKPVIMGQVSGDLLPPHPGAPEASEDELTQAALSDPADVAYEEPDPHPTFWRVLVIVLIAVGALSVVFRFAR